jgi:hypothetical protein
MCDKDKKARERGLKNLFKYMMMKLLNRIWHCLTKFSL